MFELFIYDVIALVKNVCRKDYGNEIVGLSVFDACR